MITLSENAIQRVKEMQRGEQEGYGFRVSVVGGGCSGLSYKFGFEKEPAPFDTVYEQGGLRVFVDPKSEIYIKGMVLDYIREGLQERFVVTNPNAKGACGCGTSFSA